MDVAGVAVQEQPAEGRVVVGDDVAAVVAVGGVEVTVVVKVS